MREVDEALSRAYAQRGAASPPSGVPPTPHWSREPRAGNVRSPGGEPRSAPEPGSCRPVAVTVTWHRPGESRAGTPRSAEHRSIPRRSRNFSGRRSSCFWRRNGATGSSRWPTA